MNNLAPPLTPHTLYITPYLSPTLSFISTQLFLSFVFFLSLSLVFSHNPNCIFRRKTKISVCMLSENDAGGGSFSHIAFS